MKPPELEAILDVLDRHPRVTSVHIAEGEVRLTLGEVLVAPEEGTKDDRDESLELPAGVVDPRDRIREIYRKAGMRNGKVPA